MLQRKQTHNKLTSVGSPVRWGKYKENLLSASLRASCSLSNTLTRHQVFLLMATFYMQQPKRQMIKCRLMNMMDGYVESKIITAQYTKANWRRLCHQQWYKGPTAWKTTYFTVSHSASTWPWPWFPTGTQTGFYPSFLPLRLSSGTLVVHI